MVEASPHHESLRTVVVDDEPLAREGLALALIEAGRELTASDGVGMEIVASCGDGFQAIDALRVLRPDLLLLDVQMPELDGFAVLERLKPEEVPPAVVFVTAHDEHALRAFEASALDYVMKPVAPERIRAAVRRSAQRVREVRAHLASLETESDVDARPSDAPSPLARLVVRDHRGTTVVPVAELDWIQADAYYVWLHAGSRSRLLRERMHVLERELDPAVFFRTHRSAIVRLDRVREIRSTSKYEHAVILSTGARVPLSRDRRSELERRLAAMPPSTNTTGAR